MLNFIAKDPAGGKWSTLIYVMLGRLLILMVMLGVVAAVMHFQVDDSAFFVFIAIAFIITIPYAVWLRNDERIARNLSYQFVVDAFIITGFIHFTGGIDSQLSLLYPLLILAAGIVSSGQLALKISILSIFLYATLILLEMAGVFIYRGAGITPYDQPSQVAQILMLRTLIFAMFAAACSYLADRCFLQDKQLQRLKLIANSILDNVGVPIMAVYEDGVIMSANPAAADMLKIDGTTVKGENFGAFFLQSPPRLGNPRDARKIWRMKCRDQTLISVSFQATKGNFPAAAIGSLTEQSRGIDLYLVVLRDMTDLVAKESETRLNERQQTAVDMVTEMAHVVRNPLTAIRGAGELLDTAISSMFKQARQITEDDWESVRSMCEVIFEQSQALDDKVDYFMKCADTNRDELMKLVADAEVWASKITRSGESNNADNSSG